CMVPQVVAYDGFAQRLDAVKQGGSRRNLLTSAQRRLVALIGVMVGKDLGPVAIQHEQIAVPPEAETGGGLGPELLLDTREPGLGVFPRIEIAVELVRAERMVHIRRGDAAG